MSLKKFLKMQKNILTKIAFILLLTAIIFPVASQEALKSAEEEYYDYLSLFGILERPFLNYRTLSDSDWSLDENAEHIWKGNNLGTKKTLWSLQNKKSNWFTDGLDTDIKLKLYGPDWLNSYNTAAPYGQNDGALWQGKGYNTSLSTGARLEAFGFELTIKPQATFSQNLEFDYIKPNYNSADSSGNKSIYAEKAAEYGYYGVTNVDVPQRFGNKAFWTFDWGDSEARWTLHNFTVGFGTQSIWLGSAKLNPIIHSNNAATYPKIDIGLRKTSVYMPHFGWHLGDIELRGWWGKLSESDYFDDDKSNDSNLITGLSFAYSFPGILKGFSVGINRTMLSKWNDFSAYSLFNIFIPGLGNLTSGGSDASDQRFSVTADYIIPAAGVEIYFEWARNDFSPSLDYIIRYPFHTQGWTAGLQKNFKINENNSLQILLECTDLQCSADYDRLIGWYSTFYAHHIIKQGYTNKGQWLGAGIGTGGNSQYLGAKWINKKGYLNLFIQRRNPDLDYTMYIDSRNNKTDFNNGIWTAESNIRCILDIGIETLFFITDDFSLKAKYVFEDERNPLNVSKDGSHSVNRFNNIFQLSVKYEF